MMLTSTARENFSERVIDFDFRIRKVIAMLNCNKNINTRRPLNAIVVLTAQPHALHFLYLLPQVALPATQTLLSREPSRLSHLPHSISVATVIAIRYHCGHVQAGCH